ncbi:hypothetical protein [Paracoccus sp. NSM]|uniref:hypothetical protein n=1 Tax=Paracoccus sp. NSM TaxID=3457784 RepID=UPI0040368CE5
MHEARLRRLGQRPEHAVILSPGLDHTDRGQTGWLIAGSERTTLLDGWIAGKPGQAEVTRWGAAGLQAVKRPSAALRQLFPNLLDLGRLTTRLWTLDELLAELAPLPAPLSLWIDMPGAEAEILSLVLRSNAMDRLAHVWLRSGAESWFEGASDSASLERIATGGGLTPAGRDLSDPDFPDLLFSAPGHSMAEGAGPDIRLSAKARLEKIVMLEARIVDLVADNDALRPRAEDQARMIASLEAAATKAGEATAQMASDLASMQAQLETASNEKQILEARIVDLGADNDALQARAEDQARVIASLEAASTKADEATAQMASELASTQAEVARLAAERDAALSEKQLLADRAADLEARDSKADNLADRLAAERDAALDRLAAMTERNDTLSRQNDMARDELRRAEGQVALIRDLLLRDAG